MRIIYRIYAYLFCRPVFSIFNNFLYHLSLRGLGILNYEGNYLPGEKQWLISYLDGIDSPVVLDVGANMGNYSHDIFEANKSAKVYAFEPHPSTYVKLIGNSKINKNKLFKSYNLGVGKEKGDLELFDYAERNGSAHASLYKDVITDLHKGEVVSTIVEIITLDDFLSQESIESVDLLKIDTEGNEYNVLLGVRRFLKEKKIKAIHIEFNEMNIVSRVTFKDFWDLLSDYNFYRLMPGGKLLPIINYNPISCEIYAFQNIVAIQKNN